MKIQVLDDILIKLYVFWIMGDYKVEGNGKMRLAGYKEKGQHKGRPNSLERDVTARVCRYASALYIGVRAATFMLLYDL